MKRAQSTPERPAAAPSASTETNRQPNRKDHTMIEPTPLAAYLALLADAVDLDVDIGDEPSSKRGELEKQRKAFLAALTPQEMRTLTYRMRVAISRCEWDADDLERKAGCINVTNYFGGCPHCGGNDGYRNAGRSHRFFCDAHKTSWCVGSNLFSDWRFETEEQQRAKWHIEGYADVEPLPEDTWSTDPVVREKELEQRRREVCGEDRIERHRLEPSSVEDPPF
jgi:hypothetical protein